MFVNKTEPLKNGLNDNQILHITFTHITNNYINYVLLVYFITNVNDIIIINYIIIHIFTANLSYVLKLLIVWL